MPASKLEQKRRLDGRRGDPLKQWKLSPNDELTVKKFAQYGAARNEMLRRTDTPHAPWSVVNSNVKKWARLEAMRHVLHELPYSNKDHGVVRAPEPLVVRPASSLGL